ncbi:MAG TPA: EAL domain-containing protein, partial [Longimicrobiaceae bacterium]|nr:EAL domain-containing protein [Longimicrobiaceae bacterium]
MERRCRALFQSSPYPQLLVSVAGAQVLEVNGAFAELTEHDAAQMEARSIHDLPIWSSPDTMAPVLRLMRRTRAVQNVEATIVAASGAERTVLVSATRVDLGHTRAVLAGFEDVTVRRTAERRLAQQAYHDALTGLPNRVHFHDRVQQALARADRAGTCPVVLFLDVDGFKWINDSFGHEVGDELLRQVAARLRECLTEPDTCARLGGDEFAVLLEDAHDHAHMVRTAERILQAMGRRCSLPGLETRTNVSIGIARAEPGMDVSTVLRHADLAMYMAKDAGKGTFAVFEPAAQEAAIARTTLAQELLGALDRGELVLHYQPVVNLRDRRVEGFEALARWQHPTRGLLPPKEFLHLAEENGAIAAIGRWALRSACAQCAEWQRRFPSERPLTVGVNLSRRQLSQPDLAAQVSEALAAAGLAPASLVLEVPEAILVLNGAAAAERLWSLRDLGVQVAVDDFGTGATSLAMLQRFPAQIVKLDRAFTDRLTRGRPPLAAHPAGVRGGQGPGRAHGRRGDRDRGAGGASAAAGVRDGAGLPARAAASARRGGGGAARADPGRRPGSPPGPAAVAPEPAGPVALRRIAADGGGTGPRAAAPPRTL